MAFTAASLAVLGSGAANASIISFISGFGSSSLNTTTSNNASQATMSQYTLTLPQFNDQGGMWHLLGVTIYVHSTVNLTSNFSYTKSGGGANPSLLTIDAANAFANGISAADVFGPDPITLSSISSGSTTVSPVTTDSAGICAANCVGIADPNALTAAGTNLGNYVGTGTFTLTGKPRFNVTNGKITNNNASNPITANAMFQAEIDYTYSTPEPATMGLMGSALIGLALLGKRYVRR